MYHVARTFAHHCLTYLILLMIGTKRLCFGKLVSLASIDALWRTNSPLYLCWVGKY